MAITPTTWNPADKSSEITLSNGNLTASSSLTGGSVRSVFSASAGKYYWEVTQTDDVAIGVATASADIDLSPGIDTHSWALYTRWGEVLNGDNIVAQSGGYPNEHTTIGILLDLDNLTLTFLVGNVDVGLTVSIPAGTWFAIAGYE